MESFNITFVYRETQAGKKAPVTDESFPFRGVHNGIPAPSGSIIVFKDRMGILNARDSVNARSPMTITGSLDTVISTDGSISSEILSKALRCHMPVIAASEVPTDQEMERTMQANSAPIGRVKGNRMSAYGGELRIC